MAALLSYIIKSNLQINGMHWGLEFKEGVAVTDNTEIANKLLRKGYAVTCVSPPEAPKPKEEPAAKVEVQDEPAEQADPPAPEAPAVAAPPKAKRKAKKG